MQIDVRVSVETQDIKPDGKAKKALNAKDSVASLGKVKVQTK